MMLKDRSILVTGGAGFIGSHLVERLLLDNEVTVLDNFSSGRMEFLAPYQDDPHFHLLTGDLMNPGVLDEAVSEKDFIFHLAANPDVKLGAEDTHVHLEQNVLATYNLLEAMRRNNAHRMYSPPPPPSTSRRQRSPLRTTGPFCPSLFMGLPSSAVRR